MTHLRTRHLLIPVLLVLLAAPAAMAQNTSTHSITVTNMSQQIISPPILVSHGPGTAIFRPGDPASEPLAALAEDADAVALLTALGEDPAVFDVAQANGPLLPGESVTLELEASRSASRLSAVGMLVTTNDAFFGLNSVQLHLGAARKTHTAAAFDAGSEGNSESCEHIPGPPCGNPFVRNLEGAEGFVHVHPGFFGIGGELSAAGYDWRNPVVYIRTERIAP